MKIRILKPEDYWRADLVAAVAFETPFDLEKARNAPLDEPGDPSVLIPEGCDGTLPKDGRSPIWWAAETDEGEMISTLEITAFPVRFDGAQVLMGGVGGVATLPQHRRRGGIRGCMEAALRDMADKGYVFSALYPFSTAYYRKFGYETGASVATWTVPLKSMHLPDAGGRIEIVLPGSDLSALGEVYNSASEDCNLSVIRTVYDKDLAKDNWLEKRQYIYVWRDENETPRGLIVFQKKNGVLDCTMNFEQNNNLMFSDVRALTALLKFAQSFAADYESIRFSALGSTRIQALLGEENGTRCEVRYNAMIRLVNVRRALELCRCRGEGGVKIAVTDEILKENAGVWRVDFAEGRPNRVEKTDGQPDVKLPVGALSQLIAGVRGDEDIPMMPDVQVFNPAAPFAGIFYEKKCRIVDLF